MENQINPSENIGNKRSLIPTSFGIAIICFFFNFCTIKCGNEVAREIKGIEFVIGTEFKSRDMFSGRETGGEKMPPNIWAIIAIGAAILGIGVHLKMKEDKSDATMTMLLSIIGIVALIILQFSINDQVHSKGNGAFSSNFEIPYWLTILSMASAGIISYMRSINSNYNFPSESKKATYFDDLNDIEKNDLEKINHEENETLEIERPEENFIENDKIVSISSVKTHFEEVEVYRLPIIYNRFDINEWLNSNWKLLTLAIFSLISAFTVYQFFIKNNPLKDAAIVAKEDCECTKASNEKMLKANNEFLSVFSSFSFKSRQDARMKLQEYNTPIIQSQEQCFSLAKAKADEFRKKYLNNGIDLNAFEIAYSAQKGNCNIENQAKFTSSNILVENKISSIKGNEPDIEKIKADLIGQHMLGWNFDQLSEIEKIEIINKTQAANQLEYQLKLKLAGYTNPTKDKHDAEVIVNYTESDGNWYFGNLTSKSITYNYEIPRDGWITFTPLENTSFSTVGGEKITWKTNEYGPEYETGSDLPAITLPNNNRYMVKSREGKTLTLIIKYIPNINN